MSASLRISALAAGALAAAGAATAVSPPLAAGAAVTRPAVQPGRTASPIVLDSNVQLSGYDVASGPSGNSYIGWISSKNNARKVHLCTLPPGARRCKGGIQTINSLGASSAAGLKVLVSTHDEVTLVWFHDTTASTMGPQGGELRRQLPTRAARSPPVLTRVPHPASGRCSTRGLALATRSGPWPRRRLARRACRSATT